MKVRDYLAAGTHLIWLVYPATQVVVEYRSTAEIRQFDRSATLDGGPILPGVMFQLNRLFR